jgi:hypothetical protein
MFTHATQCVRGVLDPPVSGFSLSLYRHTFLYTLVSSRFTLIINNNSDSPRGSNWNFIQTQVASGFSGITGIWEVEKNVCHRQADQVSTLRWDLICPTQIIVLKKRIRLDSSPVVFIIQLIQWVCPNRSQTEPTCHIPNNLKIDRNGLGKPKPKIDFLLRFVVYY